LTKKVLPLWKGFFSLNGPLIPGKYLFVQNRHNVKYLKIIHISELYKTDSSSKEDFLYVLLNFKKNVALRKMSRKIDEKMKNP